MKKLTSFLLILVMISAALVSALPSAAAKSPFSDVEDDRWSAGSISYAAEKGYIVGVGDGRFDPEGILTRAMAATVIWRREGSPEPAMPCGFSDVPEGEWYSDAVAWAEETGVVLGVSDDLFAPDSQVTREQLAAMLCRYAASAPVFVPERADLTRFEDGGSASDWAVDPLGWAVEAGLIEGADEDRLSPEGSATREQFAAIIERYDETFTLAYNEPVTISHYTEKDYPLVTGADFYVSTEGSDENDGSFGSPFATFSKAVEAVRGLKRTKPGDITVAFMAGEYGPLSVSLTAEDAGSPDQRITYCKYGDGDVIFDNGVTVKEEEFVPLTDEEKTFFRARSVDKIKKADVTGRIGENYRIGDLVLSDDGEMTVARYPDRYNDKSDHLIQAGRTVDENHIAVYLSVFKNRIKNYHTFDGLYLFGYITLGWYKDLIETDGCEIDPGTGDPVFRVINLDKTRGGGLRFEEGFAQDYYQMALIGVTEELDAKGEYLLTRDGNTMYVYDPSGDYVFPGGGDMISMDHADNVSFIGLTLKNSYGSFIRALYSHGVTLSLCSFSGCQATNAVSFRECEFGRRYDITVTGCEFSYTAETALEINLRDSEEAITDSLPLFSGTEGVLVDNNLFTHTSLMKGNCGALCLRCFGPTVSHNEFRRCYWEGVDFRGCVNMTAEYNVFDEVCCNGDDTGMLNNWYSIDRCGNVVRYNLFRTTVAGGINGRFALYLDDTTGTSVYSNIFYDIGATAMNNGVCKFNTFCDNLIVNPSYSDATGCEYKTYGTNAVDERMAGSDDPSVLNSIGDINRWRRVFAFFEEHPEFREKAGERWNGYFDITTDVNLWNTPEFCINNSLVITGNCEINETGANKVYDELISRYSVIENNVAYSSAENPFFVNPTIGDYRIRGGVDFPDVHFEDIGRY